MLVRRLCILGILGAACAYAQVVFNNGNTMARNDEASLTYSGSFSVTSGHANTVAVACVSMISSGALTVSSVTYGGQAMTAAGALQQATGSYSYAGAYVLVAPPTGSNTLVVSAAGGGGINVIMVDLVSFYGANQTTPVRAGTYQGTQGLSLSIASSTSPGDLTVSCAVNANSLNSTGNQTQAGYVNGDYSTGAMQYAATAGNPVSHTWSATAYFPAMVGFSIAAASSGADYSITGPSSGYVSVASTYFTITNLTGNWTSTPKTITISDGSITHGTVTGAGSGCGGTGTAPYGLSLTSGTSCTFTYTAAITGSLTLTSTIGSGTDPSPNTYSYVSSTAPSGCTFTAQANGSWTTTGTWNNGGCGHNYPIAGDAFTVTGYHVTVPAGTNYAGTCPANNTTYDCIIAPTSYNGTSGWLEVQSGGTLRLCGNAKLNAPAHASPTAFAILQLDTGGSLIFDENNGSVAYRIVPGASGGWNKLIVGTAGDTCTFGASYSCPTNISAVNNGSANPLLISTNSTTDNVTYQVYGAAIKNCGSAALGCLEYETNNVSNSYGSAGLIDIEGSVFDTTGTIQDPVGLSAVTSITMKNNRFVGDLAGVLSLSASPSNNFGGSTCLFQGNVFSGQAGWSTGMHAEAWDGCSFSGNAWGQGFVLSALNYMPMTAFSWNLQFVGDNGSPSDQTLSPAIVLNNYFIGNTSGSWHMDTGMLGANQTIDGNIFENVNASQNEGHLADDNTSNGSLTRTFQNNISLRGPNGYTAGSGLMSAMVSTPAVVAVQQHNSWFGAAHSGWGGWLDHPNGSDGMFPSNQEYLYYRSNAHWASTGSTNFALGDGQGNPSESPGSNYNVAGIGYNNIYGGSTAATYGPGVSANCNVGSAGSSSLGTHYDICTPSGTPGANDLAVDPKTLDITRNAASWAQRKHGQSCTYASTGTAVRTCVMAAMMACQDAQFCVQELTTWVRVGMQPTNLALKGKAHDGGDIGAVPITTYARAE